MSDETQVQTSSRYTAPDVTSAEHHDALEAVLKGAGASDEWLEYVMPDLQLVSANYARSHWAAGHAAGVAGYPVPNPQ